MKRDFFREAMAVLALTVCTSACADPPPGPATPIPPERSTPAVKSMKRTRDLPPVPPIRDVPIDAALQEAAKTELKAGLASTDPIVRAHAIEAVRRGLRDEGKSDLLAGLRDPAAIVRFAASMATGDLRLVDAHDRLIGLVDDDNPHVRIAARYALHRLGDKRYSHYLERTAIDPDRTLRGDTALVLGRMEEPSAIKLLRILQRDAEPGVRLQAAEALWRLGDEAGLQTLIAATVSHYPDDQLIALPAIVAPRNPKVLGHVQQALEAEYPQVQLVAARAIGELHPEVPYHFDEGYGVALQGAKSREPQQRMLAALALGAIGRADAQEVLQTLLQDKDSPGSPDVRLAAAQAILQLKGP